MSTIKTVGTLVIFLAALLAAPIVFAQTFGAPSSPDLSNDVNSGLNNEIGSQNILPGEIDMGQPGMQDSDKGSAPGEFPSDQAEADE